jgi:hypothetical protein
VEKPSLSNYDKYVPEDLLREIMEATREAKRRKEKARYPSSRDIVEAVIEAAHMGRSMHPNDFPELVISILESKGFDTRHVTEKRIWRTYENLVRRGVISDLLGVLI